MIYFLYLRMDKNSTKIYPPGDPVPCKKRSRLKTHEYGALFYLDPNKIKNFIKLMIRSYR